MTDLIIGCGAMAAGIGGIVATAVAYRRLPARNARRKQLGRMTRTELCAELTRCVGAIAACSRKGDRKGARHAHRAMKPVIRAMMRKKEIRPCYQHERTSNHQVNRKDMIRFDYNTGRRNLQCLIATKFPAAVRR